MSGSLESRVAAALDAPVADISSLSGGCVGEVYQVRLEDGRRVVVKVDDGNRPVLDREGAMLRYLGRESELPVPEVLFQAPDLLAMTLLPGTSHFSAAAQRHAAALLADLHQRDAPAFGFDEPTLIGGLHQPNARHERWIPFFREQRLLYMGNEARRSGRLPEPLFRRIERFAADLEAFLVEPARPSLLHGDVWTTNVLAEGDRITGFLDPAVYYGDPEIELAFITLFNTFGSPFFERYQELRSVAPGFWESRRDIYNLYPLLVHVRLFGGSYVDGVTRTLRQLGY